MDYYFECECGQRIRVEAGQAGMHLLCPCGLKSQIPSLRKLRKASEDIHGRQAESTSAPIIEGHAKNLMAVAGFSIIARTVALGVNIWLLVYAARTSETGLDMGVDINGILLRFLVGIVGLGSDGIVFFGARDMLRLRNYDFARLAAFLAAVPCISPCGVLGIPFGILALMALVRSDVRKLFP